MNSWNRIWNNFIMNGKEKFKQYIIFVGVSKILSMKRSALILVILFSITSYAQEVHIGIDISPSWNLNGHRTNSTAWYAEHGYGFNGGLAVKYFFNEYNALQTGLNFEYTAFDNWANNQLVSSLRFGSLHVPVLVNYSLSFFENWYLYAGGGLKYHLLNRSVSLGNKIDISASVDRFQPYAAFGMNTIIERSVGYFELGFLARYHFMELWDDVQAEMHGYSSHIVSFDLLLRYYL